MVNVHELSEAELDELWRITPRQLLAFARGMQAKHDEEVRGLRQRIAELEFVAGALADQVYPDETTLVRAVRH